MWRGDGSHRSLPFPCVLGSSGMWRREGISAFLVFPLGSITPSHRLLILQVWCLRGTAITMQFLLLFSGQLDSPGARCHSRRLQSGDAHCSHLLPCRNLAWLNTSIVSCKQKNLLCITQTTFSHWVSVMRLLIGLPTQTADATFARS